MSDLQKLRVLVVGASSGIGRAVAEAALSAGAEVAGAARRAELLAEIEGAVPVAADVRDPEACRSLVASAVTALGGLDALVYAAGVVPLAPLDEAGAALWQDVLATNVVGASLVVAACVPHLERAAGPGGRVVLLSSDSVGQPFPGLVPYAASKAALEESARGWAAEHRGLRVTTVVVGPTLTGMADRWDADRAARAFERWDREGYLALRTGGPQPPERVASAIVDLLASPEPPDRVEVLPG